MDQSPMQMLLRCALYIVYGVVAYTSLVALYRVTIHPLAKYPGPALAKLTDLYMSYHAYRGDSHIENLKLHEKYGKFVRIGPNRMSINSNTALKQIYGFKSNVQKSGFYEAFPANARAYSTHTAIDKRQHARKRRTLAHGFSDNSLRELESHIQNVSSSFTKQLYDRKESDARSTRSGTSLPWSKPYDMGLWSNNFTFDVIGAMIFSKSFGMLEDPKIRWVQEAIHHTSKHKYTVAFAQFLYNSGLDKLFLSKYISSREKLRNFAVGLMKERLASEKASEKRDFVDYLTKARDPETGKGFTMQELGSESALLITAGSDTSSTALAATFFYLTRCPAFLSKATHEVRSAFRTKDEIKPGATLTSCVFMRACIDEAMRLAPPIPAILPRVVLQGGITIDDHFFAAGTDIGVPSYAVMRNPQYYPNKPNEFVPERWIESPENPREKIELAQSAFCPFSIGPRACIARGLAYVELTVALARILWEFDFKGEEGSTVGDDGKGGYAIKDCFITQKEGPMVQFRPRAAE